MAASGQTSLPYDIGNAGDLLKHGVMAEFLRSQLIFRPAEQFRFIDLFGGEPYCSSVDTVIARRVEGLAGCAIHAAQPDIRSGRYYGAANLALKLGEEYGGRLSVVASDRDEGRRERLRESGVTLLDKEFHELASEDDYDAYAALKFIEHETTGEDLILIDPYSDFLKPTRKGHIRNQAEDVLPVMGEMTHRSAVLLFALNKDPFNQVGRRFDELQRANLNRALIMTCPPIRDSKIRGERGYYADVILATPTVFSKESEGAYFRHSLEALARKLANTLELRGRGYAMLRPRLIGAD